MTVKIFAKQGQSLRNYFFANRIQSENH